MTVIEELAAFAVEPIQRTPARQHLLRNVIIDTIACMTAGRETHLGWAATRPRDDEASRRRPATIGGVGDATIERAAYVNTYLANALDYEPVGPEGHLIASVVPAVLAFAEAHDIPGTEMLDAVAVGVEAGGRVGLAIRRPAYRTCRGCRASRSAPPRR